MDKKLLITTFLFAFLFSMLSVSAWTDDGTATQNVDGCGTMKTANAVYTVTTDISNQNGFCFIVRNTSITINLNGHTIDGDDSGNGDGIIFLTDTESFDDITIENGTISDFDDGISVYLVNDSLYIDSTNISNMTLLSNADGLDLCSENITNTILTNITANSNGYGISVEGSAILTNITANSNTQTGVTLCSKSFNSTFTDITANSNTYNGLGITTTSNSVFTNITANSNGYGITLSFSSNNTFTNITANSNTCSSIIKGGITLSSSSNNTFTNITANSNGLSAIYLTQSNYNNFTNLKSDVSDNSWGIEIRSSNSNRFTNLNISNNTNYYSLYLSISDDNVFRDGKIQSIISTSGSPTITNMTNMTYDALNEYAQFNAQIIRKWYVEVGVLDPPIQVENAKVTADDSENIWEDITSALGLTMFQLTGYTNLGGARDYVNYLITATKYYGESNSTNLNLTDNTKTTLIIKDYSQYCEGADFNNDGKVNIGDMGILGANYNQCNKTHSQGDANGDWCVDSTDNSILTANYGRTDCNTQSSTEEECQTDKDCPKDYVSKLKILCINHRITFSKTFFDNKCENHKCVTEEMDNTFSLPRTC